MMATVVEVRNIEQLLAAVVILAGFVTLWQMDRGGRS